MKRKLLSLTLVLLFILFSLILVSSVNSAVDQVMSFEEAIEFLDEKEYNLWERGYIITGTPIVVTSHLENVSSYLMWIASNGTFYQAGYPSLAIFDELGHFFEIDGLTNPDGYYVWVLKDDVGLESWLLANNGTIIEENPPRLGGPTSTPEPKPDQFPSTFEIAIIVVSCVFGTGLFVNLIKKKSNKQNSNE